MKTIHQELSELREEITELRQLLASEPPLRADAIRRLNEARKRMEKSYVPHEKVTREFLR